MPKQAIQIFKQLQQQNILPPNFIPTDKTGFPYYECTQQDPKEPNVYNGYFYYWIMIVNPQEPNTYQITQMYPYISHFEGKTYWGWANQYEFISNATKPIHPFDTNFVVARSCNPINKSSTVEDS